MFASTLKYILNYFTSLKQDVKGGEIEIIFVPSDFKSDKPRLCSNSEMVAKSGKWKEANKIKEFPCHGLWDHL